MQLVIDRADFRRLSAATQRELLEFLTGRGEAQVRRAESPGLRWRVPYDLPGDIAQRLLSKLDGKHLELLRLFAKSKDGRVSMHQLQKLTDSDDLKATTELLHDITSRLRRLIDDPDKKAQLAHWDFDATKWDEGKTTIVDGVYFVSDKTRQTLEAALGKRGK
jgi:hypothetical protein